MKSEFFTRLLFRVCLGCVYAGFALDEFHWDVQLTYSVNQPSNDRLCLFVYLVNGSSSVHQQVHVPEFSPLVTTETELGDVMAQHYYSNVTVYSHLRPAMAEQSVCGSDEQSSLGNSLTGRTSDFMSGCLSALNGCMLGSLACPSAGNVSGVWVLETVLESGFDLTITVDDAEHPEIRPKRLFTRRPLFPWSFLNGDVNLGPNDHVLTRPTPVCDGVFPLAITGCGSPISLWTVNSQNFCLLSGDGFQTARSMMYTTIPLFREHANYSCNGVIGLTDRILFSTPTGVWEARWSGGTERTVSDSLRVVLNRTVTSLQLIESRVSSLHVWAVSWDEKSLFVGQAVQNESLTLWEIFSGQNNTVCSVLATEHNSSFSRCQLISLTLSPIKSNKGIILAWMDDHYVVSQLVIEKSTDVLQVTSSLPSCIAYNVSGLLTREVTNNEPCRLLRLNGMRYLKTSVPYLFAWGSALLVSVDEGKSFYSVAVLDGNKFATSLGSSVSGHYAVTVDGKVLVGHVTSFGVTEVSSAGNQPWAYFFSQEGYLYTIEIVQRNSSNGSCIEKTVLWSPVSLSNRFYYHPNSCECVSWQVFTGSTYSTAHYTRQRIIKRSLMDNATVNSMQSARHETNNSSAEQRMRIVIVASPDKGKRNIRIEPVPVISCIGTCDGSALWERALPKVIYINRHDLYEFKVTFTDNCTESGGTRYGMKCLEQIHLSVHVTNQQYLRVRIKRTINYVYSILQYTVEIQDQGLLTGQQQPGVGLVTQGLNFQARHGSRKCALNQTSDILYIYPLTVHVGCPPGLSISFDAESTAAVSARNWNVNCDGDKQIIPCFDYGTEFRPSFRVFDHATNTSSPYHSLYTLSVIGLGRGLADSSIAVFTEAEKYRYNSINGSATLWRRADGQTNKGTTFNGSDMTGITWVCGAGNPCDELKPASALEPIKLYLLLEFSSRNVSEEYCDFTLQFTIQLRSVPIGPITIITALLSTLALLVALLLSLYLIHLYSILRRCLVFFEWIQFWIHYLLKPSKVYPVRGDMEDGQPPQETEMTSLKVQLPSQSQIVSLEND